jgi:hypothetical protein
VALAWGEGTEPHATREKVRAGRLVPSPVHIVTPRAGRMRLQIILEGCIAARAATWIRHDTPAQRNIVAPPSSFAPPRVARHSGGIPEPFGVSASLGRFCIISVLWSRLVACLPHKVRAAP